MSPRVLSGGGGGGIVVIPNDPLLNPDSPEARAYAAVQRERRRIERELNLIKRRHFGPIRNLETRELGLRKVRAYTSEPAILALIDVYDREDRDVRTAVLDHLATLEGQRCIPALAWEAVNGEDEWYRAEARRLLADHGGLHTSKTSEHAETPEHADLSSAASPAPDPMASVRGIIAQGLQSPNDRQAIAAGNLVRALNLFEFIPLMASAQVATRPQGADQRTGDLGWIMIGRQQTFIADLQPVVSNNAVAFDPQIGVLSDGVLLRIHQAVVTAFRTEIHTNLVDWTSGAWGHPTGHLGYEPDAWKRWYDNEFVPSREAEPEAVEPAEPAPVDD